MPDRAWVCLNIEKCSPKLHYGGIRFVDNAPIGFQYQIFGQWRSSTITQTEYANTLTSAKTKFRRHYATEKITPVWEEIED